MPLAIEVFHPRNPGDTQELREALRLLPKDRIRRLVVFGKTEGPATLNDYSRDLAQLTVDAAIREVGGAALLERSTRLFSTGCEGVASPITVLLADIEGDASHREGLAFGAAVSEPVPDAVRAGPVHIAAAQDTVTRACKDAGLTAAQVGLVLIKSPILSPAQAARQKLRKRHGGSTGSSRGAAAIGAGLALGEIGPRGLDDDPVGRAAVYAQRVMAFSGTEVDRIEAVVIGTRPGGDPRWAIKSKVIQDLADGDALRAMRTEAGNGLLLALFKAGIADDGTLRGKRTTMLTSDLTPDKQLRAAASGVIAACLGGVDAFISAGAEHQAPAGACLCALIVRNNSASL
jgi:cyanuric acid amidohydrolase